jgi:hypothetical protein
MAGKPYNIHRDTKERFDGSPLIAMRTNPHFSRLRFCELEDNALALETALRDQFSGDMRYKVVHGDCNKAIDATLAEFVPYRRLTELTMVADSVREPVDNSAVRSIPVRRLAYTAAQWIDRLAGLLAYVEDTSEVWVRPENADPKIYSAAQIADQALSLGLPVRPTVARTKRQHPHGRPAARESQGRRLV